MPTGTYVIQEKTATSTQIVWAGEGPVLIANTSLTGTFWIGETNSLNVSDQSGIVPIGPNGSVAVDGSRDFFAVTNSATPVRVSVIAGGMSTFLGLTGGNGSLVLPSVFSPNFLAGVSGWTINSDGSAQFNNLDIRGIFNGTNYVINTSGAFFYSGAPAANNLLLSITNGTGVDGFGNLYFAGLTVYNKSGATYFAMQMASAGIEWWSAASQAGPWTVSAEFLQVSSGAMELLANSLIVGVVSGGGNFHLNWSTPQLDLGVSPTLRIDDSQGTVGFPTPRSTVPAALAYPNKYSDNVGNLNYVNGVDGLAYRMGRQINSSVAGQVFSTVSPTTITGMGLTLGIGNYHLTGWVNFTGAAAVGAAVFSFGGAATVARGDGKSNFWDTGGAVIHGITVWNASVAGNVGSGTMTGALQRWEFDIFIQITVAGTFNVRAQCSIAADNFTVNSAYIRQETY